MINERELRIGNFVSDLNASDRFFAAVKKLDYSRCYYGQFHSAYSDLKPIPITEEWLKLFGFEKLRDENRKQNYQCRNKFMLHDNSGVRIEGAPTHAKVVEVYYEQYSFMDGYGLKVKITHIHQLQNLYFALTGEELTLKDK